MGDRDGRAGLRFASDTPHAGEIFGFTEVHNDPSREVLVRLGMQARGVPHRPALIEDRPGVHANAPFALYARRSGDCGTTLPSELPDRRPARHVCGGVALRAILRERASPEEATVSSSDGVAAARARPWRTATLVVLILVSAVCWLPASPGSAAASCATDRPPRSSAAFTGVVTATTSRGRVATVRTGTGVEVEVVGTPDRGSQQTSVDRTYEVGGRYEFHPTNDTSPYQDNSCTATRLLSRGVPPAADAAPYSPAAAVVALVVAVVAGAVLVARRRLR